MKVINRAVGDLREYLGKGPQEIEIAPEGSSAQDLLTAIEIRYGAGLPGYLWDFQKHQFRGPVVLVMNKKAIQDFKTLLEEGVEITIMKAVAGGMI